MIRLLTVSPTPPGLKVFVVGLEDDNTTHYVLELPVVGLLTKVYKDHEEPVTEPLVLESNTIVEAKDATCRHEYLHITHGQQSLPPDVVEETVKSLKARALAKPTASATPERRDHNP